MNAPVSTTNLSIKTALSDELVVNRDGSTALQSTADLAIQLANQGAVADGFSAASQDATAKVAVEVQNRTAADAELSGRIDSVASIAYSSTNTYESIAAGLAATPNGQQFQVPSGTQVVRYRNDNGVAVETARLPTAAFFSALPLLEYGVSIYNEAGVSIGEYYASRSADVAGVLRRFSTEIVSGSILGWADVYLEVGNRPVSGPHRVAFGPPLVMEGLAIPLLAGEAVTVSIVDLSGLSDINEIVISVYGGIL